jgi:hypothetical protein
MITAERLRDVLAYEKSTGVFRWRVRTSNRINIGDVAGSKHRDGFRKIAVDGVSYLGQRLAVLHVTGSWPEQNVTRRNLDRSDNSWRNIRAA